MDEAWVVIDIGSPELSDTYMLFTRRASAHAEAARLAGNYRVYRVAVGEEDIAEMCRYCNEWLGTTENQYGDCAAAKMTEHEVNYGISMALSAAVTWVEINPMGAEEGEGCPCFKRREVEP